MFRFLCVAALWGICMAGGAEQVFPGPDWTEKPNPIASPDAYAGGEISIFAGPSPKSLNYYLDNNVFSAEVFGALYESLLSSDPMTMEETPGLAEKWSISDDKKAFTFWIDPRATWSDGKPVTAEDVAWTFEAIMNPENMTGVHKVALEVFDPPEVLGPRQIRFHARQVHWRNLDAVGGMLVLPKHAYADKDFDLINFEFPVVSGAYRLGEIKEGIYITLERREDYWNRDSPRMRGVGNFQTLKFRIFESRENAYQAFLKGDIDLYPIYTSRIWVNETKGEKFLKNWIVKQKVHNANPVGFQGFAMNMRRPPFDDVRVRNAMGHLVNRQLMNRTLMYDQYFMHKSYYEDLWDDEHPAPNQPVPFDKEAARELLAQAGWKVPESHTGTALTLVIVVIAVCLALSLLFLIRKRSGPATALLTVAGMAAFALPITGAGSPDAKGILHKDGVPFRFHFLSRSPSSSKFLVIFAEDLKDVGIEMVIDQKDWAAWSKDMSEFNYQMTWAAWSAGVRKDPEGMWHSKEAERESGNNITGFKDPRVDALIEKQKTIFDISARHDIVREIDKIVFDSHPYALLWNIDYTRLLYWNKFGTPPTVLSKYGDERSAYWYWWADEDLEADLRDAMDTGDALPPRPFEVHFDEAFAR